MHVSEYRFIFFPNRQGVVHLNKISALFQYFQANPKNFGCDVIGQHQKGDSRNDHIDLMYFIFLQIGLHILSAVIDEDHTIVFDAGNHFAQFGIDFEHKKPGIRGHFVQDERSNDSVACTQFDNNQIFVAVDKLRHTTAHGRTASDNRAHLLEISETMEQKFYFLHYTGIT